MYSCIIMTTYKYSGYLYVRSYNMYNIAILVIKHMYVTCMVICSVQVFVKIITYVYI